LGDELTGIPPLSKSDLKALVERGPFQTQGKGGKRRILILPPKGREALAEFAAGLEGDLSRPVFPISPQAVNSMLHRLGFAGGAHSFRHAYRARLRQAGIGEEIQACLMGHGPKSVTNSYGAAGVEELLAVVERLS
jgi:integrase